MFNSDFQQFLFIDDDPADISDEDEPETTNNPTNEISMANLELGDGDKTGELSSTVNQDTGTSSAKDVKPKRKIAKQPLLNADRILGKRGIRVIEKMFQDFEPQGNNILVLCFLYTELYLLQYITCI